MTQQDREPGAGAEPSLPEGAEITWPDDRQGGVDRPSPPGYRDPAAKGSVEAAKPPPQEDAEQLESALREGPGFLRPADEYAEERRRQPTEEGPGTSLP